MILNTTWNRDQSQKMDEHDSHSICPAKLGCASHQMGFVNHLINANGQTVAAAGAARLCTTNLLIGSTTNKLCVCHAHSAQLSLPNYVTSATEALE